MTRLDSRGLTIVELMVTCVIVSILSVVLVAFLGNWTEQHAISQTRVNLLADAQNALDQITDKVRLSASADQNNRWEDSYAPGAPGDLLSWSSSANVLVLASAEEDSSGSIVFSDALNYTSQKNNIIYYVSNGTLYQRTLAAPDDDNAATTSCPPADATSSCPADKRMADNVSNFTVRYYDSSNAEVAPTSARSVGLSLTLTDDAYKQQVSETYETRMVFRND